MIAELMVWRFSSRVEISTRYTKLKKNYNYMKNFNHGWNIILSKKQENLEGQWNKRTNIYFIYI